MKKIIILAYLPCLKASRAASLSCWVRSPWIEAERKPLLYKNSSKLSAILFVSQNTKKKLIKKDKNN